MHSWIDAKRAMLETQVPQLTHILLACLPSLRPVFNMCTSRTKSAFSRQSNYGNSAYDKSAQGLGSRKFGNPEGYTKHPGSGFDREIESTEVDEYPLVHMKSDEFSSKMGRGRGIGQDLEGIHVEREFKVVEMRR